MNKEQFLNLIKEEQWFIKMNSATMYDLGLFNHERRTMQGKLGNSVVLIDDSSEIDALGKRNYKYVDGVVSLSVKLEGLNDE